MGFVANRDLRVEASEAAPGRFVLRTRGLADKKRAELEMAGVPEAALQAAGGVINMLADYSVNSAEIFADQNVGNVLTVGEDGRRLMLLVRAVEAERPKGGFFSKLVGSNKGVLRLEDIDREAPLTALATMLVHRATVRLAKDDDEGAAKELEAALATLPGEEGKGPAPSLDADGELNWQNHLAYLDLAMIAERAGEHDQAATWYGQALARSEELARRELGTTLDALRELDGEEIASIARAIIEHNLGTPHIGPGPTPALTTVASPIWEPRGAEGEETAHRLTSLMPARLVELYYEGAAADGLRRAGASLTVAILAHLHDRPWKAAWIARAVRDAWVAKDFPSCDAIGAFRPAQGLVSAVLADVARCFRAGASDAEILARYTGDEAAAATLSEKLNALEAWEGEQYSATLRV